MEQLVAALEASLGDWKPSSTPVPQKNIDQPTPEPAARLVVVDRPNSPSSFLTLGRLTTFTGQVDGMESIELANEVMGDGFLSRLNDDLRETRGWTYGIRSSLPGARGPRRLQVSTQVQADRTADSIRVIMDQMAAFPATRPIDSTEFQRVTDGNTRNLPNRYETNEQVLGALLGNQFVGRDLRYQASLPAIYRSMSADQINSAAAQHLQPENLVIVVVGDRETIDPQLETLGMPIEYIDADQL